MSPPLLTLDFEVTGRNLDALLDAARADVAALLGEHRTLTDVKIIISDDETLSDGTGIDRVIQWGATITGTIVDPDASIGPGT